MRRRADTGQEGECVTAWAAISCAVNPLNADLMAPTNGHDLWQNAALFDSSAFH
jgi:hypothetical protein